MLVLSVINIKNHSIMKTTLPFFPFKLLLKSYAHQSLFIGSRDSSSLSVAGALI